jgi:hypothetical protein
MGSPKRLSVQPKIAIAALASRAARETQVSITRLTEWREHAIGGAGTALKKRERDDRDNEIARG